MTTKSKEYPFPVAVHWQEGRTVHVHVEGKEHLPVMSPPEFNRDADPSVWSPEDLFGAAAAACLAVTITGLAVRQELALQALSVDAVGTVGRREDGNFGFTKLEQRVAITVAQGDEERARALVERAEETCLVTVSLDVPKELAVDVHAVALAR